MENMPKDPVRLLYIKFRVLQILSEMEDAANQDKETDYLEALFGLSTGEKDDK